MAALFVIHALDEPDALPRRLATYEAHKAYLDTADAAGVRIVTSGPLVADDGTTMIGSLLIVEAAERSAVEAFNRADPFQQAGVWRAVAIHRFLRRRG
jgi:uncharacterized protein YciI